MDIKKFGFLENEVSNSKLFVFKLKNLIYFSKFLTNISLTTVVIIYMIVSVHSNIIRQSLDEGIYSAIYSMLTDDFGYNEDKAQCMIDDFRERRLADNFYSLDYLFDSENLQKEIQPYVDDASTKCTLSAFFSSPSGICVVIGIVLLVVGLIGLGVFVLIKTKIIPTSTNKNTNSEVELKTLDSATKTNEGKREDLREDNQNKQEENQNFVSTEVNRIERLSS